MFKTVTTVIVVLSATCSVELFAQDAVKKFSARDYPTFWAARKDLSGRVAQAENLRLREGFRAELLYTVPIHTQGSWVCLTSDPRGRLIASDHKGGLFRITPPPIDGEASATKVEPLGVSLRGAQGLLFAFDSLYVVANGSPGIAAGLYRVRDTNNDDKFDDVRLLRRFYGGGDHGPHAVIAGPDGKSLYLIAGNSTRSPSPERWLDGSERRDDRLLFSAAVARALGEQGPPTGSFGKTSPGGWVCRTDPDGKSFELVCSGFRNAYDIAFNRSGELFSYDSDNEGEIGMPWYRPTRVNHIVSGGEYGWRMMTSKWPSDLIDSCGSVLDVGRGSPTGVVFGTGAKFPAKYQNALFACDWSQGNLYAMHLQPDGATYRATHEPLVSGAPLPISDLVIHPLDGAMYFIVGGRGVTSALYRITYIGDESTTPVRSRADAGTKARTLRRQMEVFHGRHSADALKISWPYLSHADRSIRFAARIAVESQPVATWTDRALTEKNSRGRIAALVALARHGNSSLQDEMAKALAQIDWKTLSSSNKLDLVRAHALVLARTGKPSDKTRKAIIEHLDPHFPSGDSRLDRELVEVLCYLKTPGMIERALKRLEACDTQEDEIHYVICLLTLDEGWSIEQRKKYFRWFVRASGHRGGVGLGFLYKRLKRIAISRLSPEEKETLGALLRDNPPADPVQDLENRKFVKKWSVKELVSLVHEPGNDADPKRGRAVFSSALCYRCHRMGGAGGIQGPDLTTVGKRFSTQVIIESIVEPSKEISDQYRMATVVLDNGKTLTGKISDVSGNTLLFVNDVLNMTMTTIDSSRIESSVPSDVSMMPVGLLDRFTAAEIRDLVAYLRASEGDR